MSFETLKVHEYDCCTELTINRLSNNNSISSQLLKDLHKALDMAEDKADNKIIILQGQRDLFCTGMDFSELIAWDFSEEKIHDWAANYMFLLRRLSSGSNVVIANLDGKVIAGGTGLVAASDFVLSSPRTTFKLTEVLWGLIPAMVTPYLIRRIGFQKAYAMTLLANTTDAEEALHIQLIDEVSEKPEIALEKLVQRISRLQSGTIGDLKSYFKRMWIIDRTLEEAAVDEITRLLKSKEVQANIRNFVEHKQLPWK